MVLLPHLLFITNSKIHSESKSQQNLNVKQHHLMVYFSGDIE